MKTDVVHQDAAVEVGAADQVKDASGKASAKPWKRRMCLLVFSPKCPKGFEPIQDLKYNLKD